MGLREVIIQFNSRFDPRGMLAMLATMRKARTEAEQFEHSLQKVTAAFMGMGTASVLAFKNYEMSLTEFAGKAMNTVQEFGRKFSKVSGQISRDTGVIRHEVLRGLQEGTSALLTPIDSTALTKKAAILHAGHQSNIRQAVSVALSGYRNKFGKPDKVLDYTYAAAQLGQGQVAEFAPALQYVFGFARGAGLELKEVAAGISAISATAPSPIMGSTQFGAFLTGIARGSTYEKKLIEQAGVDSQGLRDMLRQQGLAHTVEFLASKFTGDELQQVFGRKEFVQFVQGTTGRRGIVAKLEKLITDNAESKPIEKFGEDLNLTLQNKWDRFIQTLTQLGVQYGKPLALAAKYLLDVGRVFMDGLIFINDTTNGVFAWLITGIGLTVGALTLFRSSLGQFVFGLLGHITGLAGVFGGRYVNAGKAGMGAPMGEKLSTAGAAFMAGGAAEDVINAGRPTVSATGATPEGQAGRAAASGASVGGSSTRASVDTGASAWNEMRRNQQRAFYERMRAAGDDVAVPGDRRTPDDVGSRLRAEAARRARHERMEDIRTTHWETWQGMESRRNAYGVRRLSDQRAAYAVHLSRMASIVDDMIAQGYVDPAHRRTAISSLLTHPNALNDFMSGPAHGFGSFKGAFPSTGFTPLDPHVNQFSPNMVKKKHQSGFLLGHWANHVDWNQYVRQKYRTKSRHLSNIQPQMLLKSKEDMFNLVSQAPWLHPGLYYKQHQSKVEGYANPLSFAGEYIAAQAAKPKPKSTPLSLGAPATRLLGFDKPGPPPPPPRGRWGRFVDMFASIPLIGGAFYDRMRSGSTYEKAFGKGSFGTGFGQGVDGTKWNAFIEGMTLFNSSEEQKGRKGMRQGIASMAFWLGKMFRMATNPAALIVASAGAAYLAARLMFNATDAGKQHLALLEMKRASYFSTEKILQHMADSSQATTARVRMENITDPETLPQRNVSGWLSWFQQFGTELGDLLGNVKNMGIIDSEVQEQVNMLLSGKVDAEGVRRLMISLRGKGLDGFTVTDSDFIPNHILSGSMGAHGYQLPSQHPYNIIPKWSKDRTSAYHLVEGKMLKKDYDEQGREPITKKIPWPLMNDPYFIDMANSGPLAAQRYAAEVRAEHYRLQQNARDNKPLNTMSFENVLNIYTGAIDAAELEGTISEEVAKHIRAAVRGVFRDHGMDVVESGEGGAENSAE